PSSGFDPIGLGLQLLGLDQWLRSDVLQHLPVAFRLAAWEVHGVRTKIVDRQRVVLFRGNVRGSNIQAGDRRGPVGERPFVPSPGDVGFHVLGRSKRPPEDNTGNQADPGGTHPDAMLHGHPPPQHAKYSTQKQGSQSRYGYGGGSVLSNSY